MQYCEMCDFYRCTKTLDEIQGKNPHIRRHQIKAATVCVQPDSVHYGEHRRKYAVACECYADWFYKRDFDGKHKKVRAAQAKLVDKYRRERLKLKTPFAANGGAGYAAF